MKRPALLLAAALLAAPAAAQIFPGDMAPTPRDERAAANRGLFIAIGPAAERRVGCLTCHGADGMGDSSGAFPRLAGLDAETIARALDAYATGDRPNSVMGPVAASLTPQERRDVAAYYASIAPRATPGPDPSARDRQTGGALAAVGDPRAGIAPCATCHGAAGEGTTAAPALAGQYAAYLELQLRLWKQGVRGHGEHDVMAAIARAMSDEQIRAAALYFAALTPRGARAAADMPAPAAPPPMPAQTPGGAGAPAQPPYLPADAPAGGRRTTEAPGARREAR